MTPRPGTATLDTIDRFDCVVDVRTPAEFAEDHLPGAINCPVLSNEQRIEVGTCYKQKSPFDAKKLGAAYVAENIARHLRQHFADRSRDWKPLIYCWRGGERSGAMTHIFRRIGWDACQLVGGYKTFRRQVVDDLTQLPTRFCYRVICGPTGSAKSRVLEALAASGEAVLDLEGLAAHKGSVLGPLPDQPQPSQKAFETALWKALRQGTPERPLYVEAESRKIGNLHLPEALITAMRASPCLFIEASREARVTYLLRDYDYFVTNPDGFLTRLEHLRKLLGDAQIARWADLVAAGDWRELVTDLLARHYDPLYQRSQQSNYQGYADSPHLATEDLSEAGIADLARRIAALQGSAMVSISGETATSLTVNAP